MQNLKIQTQNLDFKESVITQTDKQAKRMYLYYKVSYRRFPSTIIMMILLVVLLFTSISLLSVDALFLTMGTGNTFGRLFRISTWGESHGGGVGVQLDGCPPRISLSREEIQYDLDRRRPGQSRITTPRNEADAVEIISGITPDGITLGTPIAMLVRNTDQRSSDYLDNDMKVAYRPSHADATYDAKYGVRAVAGGGRSSARETIGRVAAGAVARKVLYLYNQIEILAYVSKVQEIETHNVDWDTFTMDDVDANMVRCPDPIVAEQMLQRIDEIRKSGNSIGGVVTCVARNVPAGLGAPVFDKLEADLAKAMMSIPAAKGFESGDGFAGTLLTGKEHNDEFYIDPITGATRTKTNRSGGIQGGISNGENIVIHVAFKPTSTIGQVQVRNLFVVKCFRILFSSIDNVGSLWLRRKQ
jgi:chorismate synthase